jgi:hypothetical protein
MSLGRDPEDLRGVALASARRIRPVPFKRIWAERSVLLRPQPKASRVPVRSMIRPTGADTAVSRTNPPRSSARRRVARTARRPAQSMNETPDKSSRSLAPRSHMIRSRTCCSGSSVETSISPLTATTVP